LPVLASTSIRDREAASEFPGAANRCHQDPRKMRTKSKSAFRIASAYARIFAAVVEWAAGVVEDLTHGNTTGDQIFAGRVDVLNS